MNRFSPQGIFAFSGLFFAAMGRQKTRSFFSLLLVFVLALTALACAEPGKGAADRSSVTQPVSGLTALYATDDTGVKLVWQDTNRGGSAYRLSKSDDEGNTWTHVSLDANAVEYWDENVEGEQTVQYKIAPANDLEKESGISVTPSLTFLTSGGVGSSQLDTEVEISVEKDSFNMIIRNLLNDLSELNGGATPIYTLHLGASTVVGDTFVVLDFASTDEIVDLFNQKDYAGYPRDEYDDFIDQNHKAKNYLFWMELTGGGVPANEFSIKINTYPEAPASPSRLTVTESGEEKHDIEWVASAVNTEQTNNPDVYIIEYTHEDMEGWVVIGSTENNQYQDDYPKQAAGIQYRVSAANNGGISAPLLLEPLAK